jgi:hypothetical protein
MAKSRKGRTSMLVPAVVEVPRIPDAERDALVVNLAKARADIAAGKYAIVTAATLRREFKRTSGGARTRSKKSALNCPRKLPS